MALLGLMDRYAAGDPEPHILATNLALSIVAQAFRLRNRLTPKPQTAISGLGPKHTYGRAQAWAFSESGLIETGSGGLARSGRVPRMISRYQQPNGALGSRP